MAENPAAEEDKLLSEEVSQNTNLGVSIKTKKAEQVRWRDLPNKDQLFILAICRLSEPLSNTCLLPYIYYLIKSIVPPKDGSTSASEQDISKMSGLLVAAFPLAQFVTSMIWGRLSDTHGRKGTILFGLLVSSLSNLAFGFSRSFGALLFWRVLAGLVNGNVGVMRTVTAEIVREKKYETKAFLLLPLVFNSGMVAGLALGGCLAEPAINLPWLFGPDGILNVHRYEDGVKWAITYPYALPALLNAVVLGGAFVLAWIGLRETLAAKEDDRDVGILVGQSIYRFLGRHVFKSYAYTPLSTQEVETPSTSPMEETKPLPPRLDPKPRIPFGKIWTRPVISALVSFFLLPLHNSAFMHIAPVFLSAPPAPNPSATPFHFTGGLGLRSPSIGLYLSVFGILGILLQLFIYPRLQTRLGTLGVFRIALFAFPTIYFCAPYLALIPPIQGTSSVRYVPLALILCGQVLARTLAIPSTVILLTNAAPAKNVLGTVHGAGNALSSLARAVGPAVGGLVFGWGMERGVVGAVWWGWLCVVAVAALGWSYTMRES